MFGIFLHCLLLTLLILTELYVKGRAASVNCSSSLYLSTEQGCQFSYFFAIFHLIFGCYS